MHNLDVIREKDMRIMDLEGRVAELEDAIAYTAAILRNDRFKDRVKNALVELDEVLLK